MTILLASLTCLLLTSACALAQDASAPAKEVAPVDIRPGVKAYINLDYAGTGEGRQMLDLFLPTEAQGPLPLVVWIHGGGWSGGDKGGPLAEPDYTARGYAVASLNYRYSQQAVYPAQIEDCKGALRYLRANAGKFQLDPKHFGVWGHSAGGHLSALLGTTGDIKALEGKVGGNLDQSSRVQAVADLAGPTDLLLINQPPILKDVFRGLVGAPPAEKKELAILASSVTFASHDDPPFLIVHGQVDDIVPILHAEKLNAALQKAGVDSALLPQKNTGHGGGGFDAPETRKTIADFFDKHLKPATTVDAGK